MVLTENEAAKKWCPKVQLVLVESGALVTNRYSLADAEHCCCIGSFCMWWRWVDVNKTTGLCGAID
jgi:hypothetical protein